CYVSVGLGLTIDIGIWWRIVFPVFHWQLHSVLFEVAWCIMLYLGVLMFEFGHSAMEKLGWERLLHIAHKVAIFFVIAGISLSTLHQSSLGTLFLATPFRLHPLWHTDLLPLLFFVSAIGVGCLTISVVTVLVHWLYNAKPPAAVLAGLGRISAYVLAVYLVIKMAGIFWAGKGQLLVAPGWDTANFWLELLLSAILPALLLFSRRYRESPTAMLWIGIMATVGLGLNRINVAGLATLSTTHASYWPSWTEWAVTAGVLSGAGLFYLFSVEYFGLFAGIKPAAATPVYEPGKLDHTDGAALYFAGQRLGHSRVYSLALVLGAALSFGTLPRDAVFGVEPLRTPTQPPRLAETTTPVGRAQANQLEVALPLNDGAVSTLATLMIDGNRDGRRVFFAHDAHAQRLRQQGQLCAACHHMNMPHEKASGCSSCHADMYLSTDIFAHAFHAKKLGDNAGCSECHADPSRLKTRANTKGCAECHETMRASETLVKSRGPAPSEVAAGYEDAMHGLCISCHERAATTAVELRQMAACATCHREDVIGADRLAAATGIPAGRH
ncbi:MAG: cytochrome c3 family protein, partial [Pseudomonadota bacterium]